MVIGRRSLRFPQEMSAIEARQGIIVGKAAAQGYARFRKSRLFATSLPPGCGISEPRFRSLPVVAAASIALSPAC
jgi:hypothetical protein